MKQETNKVGNIVVEYKLFDTCGFASFLVIYAKKQCNAEF